MFDKTWNMNGNKTYKKETVLC